MGLHYYRCSRCRTRNKFKRAVSTYLVPKKCRDCGYKKFYPDKDRAARESCRCDGAYHWGAHRWGAQYCEHNPDHQYHRAVRDGATTEELAWAGLGLKSTGTDVPF